MCCFFPLTPVPVPLPVRLPPPLLVPPLRGLPLLPPPSKELPLPLPLPPLPLSVPSDLPTISVSPASLLMLPLPLPLPLPDSLADVALAVNLLILIGRGSGRIPPAGKERKIKLCKKSKLLRERMSMQHHDLFELLSQKKIVMKKDPSTQFLGIELLAVMARSAGR